MRHRVQISFGIPRNEIDGATNVANVRNVENSEASLRFPGSVTIVSR